MIPINPSDLELTIVVTVVSGKECTRNHLARLCPQLPPDKCEVIVPFDKWSAAVGSLASEFPEANFQYVEWPELTGMQVHMSDHRLYDRRRAAGLRLSRGNIVAMTEDHAVPAGDWVEQILTAHEQPYDVIGGAIENGVDHPVNLALYYCDFGRYGRPFESNEAAYLSDVNLSYKRDALAATKDLWRDAYQETTVNWALRSMGKKLYLDVRPVVYQCRPRLSFRKLVGERVQWGHVFALTRAKQLSSIRRVLFAVGTLLLPPILFFRAFGNMRRQKTGFVRMLPVLPIVLLLVTFWSVGELVGYVTGGVSNATERTGVSTVEDAWS